MRRAPTQIILHAFDDLLARGLWIPQQQTVCVENHTRRAETALKGIVLYERLLDWMQLAVLCQTFDGKNVFSLDAADRRYARPDGSVVHYDGAGAAQAVPAAEFRSREPQVGTQHPQKRSFAIRGQAHRFLIEFEGNGFIHVEPSLSLESKLTLD